VFPDLRKALERGLQTEAEVLRKICDDGSVRIARADDPEELGELIVEREWFDQGFPQRVAALIRHHRERHGKHPQRVFLPDRFVNWVFKRWGSQLVFDIQSEPVPLRTDPESGEMRTEPMPALFERLTLEVRPINPGEEGSDRIRLDTVLESSEASIRCGYCMGEFPLLVAEMWTRVGCRCCGKMLLIEWNSATGEIVIYPVEETDKP